MDNDLQNPTPGLEPETPVADEIPAPNTATPAEPITNAPIESAPIEENPVSAAPTEPTIATNEPTEAVPVDPIPTAENSFIPPSPAPTVQPSANFSAEETSTLTPTADDNMEVGASPNEETVEPNNPVTEQPPVAESAATPTAPVPAVPKQAKPKSKSKNILIIVLIVLVLAVAGVLAFSFLNK